MIESRDHSLLMQGIDGGNMLAYLAALGTLRILTDALDMPVQMSWSASGGTWRPWLYTPSPIDSQHIIQALTGAFTASRNHPDAHPCMAWNKWDAKAVIQDRRIAFETARSAMVGGRAGCDWLSAIGSDLLQSDKEAIDTPLRASRADYLLGNLRTILTKTTGDHLQRSLFVPWTYDDPLDNASLKFDPSEDRRHALQWSAPTKDKDRKRRGNMLGANRLAMEALPLFTSVLHGQRLATTACSRPNEDWQITWGLWSDPISLDTTRSLLTLKDLSGPLKSAWMRAFGLCAVFRCHRQTIGKTRVFTPACCIA